MKLQPIFFKFMVLITGIFILAGCIKERPLNIEADIVSVENPSQDFFAEPQITNRTVKIFVNTDKNDLRAFSFYFSLSRGATSIPASGSVQDFSKPVEYVVTSENGEFSKTYTVTATDETVAFTPLFFDFENYTIDPQHKYTVFHDLVQDKIVETWASGNAGFVLSISPLVTKKPTLYPLQFTDNAHSGKVAAKLETKSTGVFGSGAKKPIAAGNIFLGKFDGSNVMGDPLKSTWFGMPIRNKPISFEGFYHYTPGKQVIDHNSKPVLETDSCSMVAVLFDAEALYQASGSFFLDGTNLLTDKSVIAVAAWSDHQVTAGQAYKHFDVPFHYVSDPIPSYFETGRYRLAIVLSASKNGDHFKGAVGSTLFIDDLKINTP